MELTSTPQFFCAMIDSFIGFSHDFLRPNANVNWRVGWRCFCAFVFCKNNVSRNASS
jgi:hypothetical protein